MLSAYCSHCVSASAEQMASCLLDRTRDLAQHIRLAELIEPKIGHKSVFAIVLTSGLHTVTDPAFKSPSEARLPVVRPGTTKSCQSHSVSWRVQPWRVGCLCSKVLLERWLAERFSLEPLLVVYSTPSSTRDSSWVARDAAPSGKWRIVTGR